MQAISLPVCRMAVMTLQDLWPLIPVLREANDRDIVGAVHSTCFQYRLNELLACVHWRQCPVAVDRISVSPNYECSSRHRGQGVSSAANIEQFEYAPYRPAATVALCHQPPSIANPPEAAA